MPFRRARGQRRRRMGGRNIKYVGVTIGRVRKAKVRKAR